MTEIPGVAEAEEAPYILCEDLFKIYKVANLEVVALRGLDLKVPRGELMAIVGASGSGKSTLLNILAGLDQPSAGRAFVGGKDLLTMSAAEMVEYRRRQVGFVWQQTGRNLIPYLDALQNVEVPLILDGMPRKAARERARELLSAVGLEARMSHIPNQLSGGEQQRVSIAVALANDPPLLLADEPTGELDSIGANLVFELFGDLNRRYGVTVVVVTHDPDIAARVDRVIAIRDGRTSTEVFRRVRHEGNTAEFFHEEYVLVDGAGRLQIPRAYLDQLKIHDRAKLLMGEGRVEVLPEHTREGR
ncbi:MAG: ABC transporter ATP-binding protein [Dehalococcoidia bacterium]|nr:ABC transporter ATP-binding protein [Dehalococcoidia bacterium]